MLFLSIKTNCTFLRHAAKKCPPLAMAIAWEIKDGRFKEDSNIIEFSIIDIAAAIGWNSGVVKYQLKNLEWTQGSVYKLALLFAQILITLIEVSNMNFLCNW